MTEHHIAVEAILAAREGVCPACNGSTRRPYDYTHDPKGLYRRMTATYRAEDDTLACNNCGGQTMSLRATGRTRIDPTTGLGCLHEYRGQKAGNCYHIYTCTKCGDHYDIDSGD
jgi:hypothetical protein